MAWTPDFIQWSIDNEVVRRISSDDPSVKLTTRPQSVMMNFWTPTFESWGTNLDDKDMPWYALYDYVEVFSWNEHTNEFEFKWRDDFEDFNLNRWHKAEGGFENNSSEFHKENVYTSHGKLVLKMEPLNAHKKYEFIPYDHEFHAGEFVHENRPDSENTDDNSKPVHEKVSHGHADGIPTNSKKDKKSKHKKGKKHKHKKSEKDDEHKHQEEEHE